MLFDYLLSTNNLYIDIFFLNCFIHAFQHTTIVTVVVVCGNEFHFFKQYSNMFSSCDSMYVVCLRRVFSILLLYLSDLESVNKSLLLLILL